MREVNESGLCLCGCGEATRLASQTVRRKGWVKGKPIQFVNGHNGRVMERTAEHGRKIGEAQRMAWSTKRQRMPVGTTRKNHHGYVLVKTRKGEGRWDKQHVLVVEREIGRRLFPGEVVHHINAIRDDNRPENLYLCRNGSEHSRSHHSLNRLIAGLLADGVVRFNRATGEYERC